MGSVMQERSQLARDRVVRVLAGISLVAVLAVMGALFVGSAAQGTTQAGADSTTITEQQASEPVEAGVLQQASPFGLVLGALVVGGGLVVLLVGAFKPPHRHEARDLAELLRP